MKYKVTVERDTLRFSAAHFATFRGDGERLHGHNYHLLVELEGDLTEDGWVIDFRELKSIAAAICHELDHHFLLPRHSPALAVSDLGQAWQIDHQKRRYVIPKGDVYELPVDNSTAERLAQWFCQRLAQVLRQRPNISVITVGVEEARGQTGWCSLKVDAS